MTDIVEYVEQKFRSGNSAPIDRSWLSADEWAQLRAEIGRLRGNVELLRVGIERERVRATIAPAEAKVEVPGEGWPLRYTPQPADGEAVAWRTRHRDVDWSFTTRPHPRDLAAGIWEPLYTTTPAAQVQGEALACGRVEIRGVTADDPGYVHLVGDYMQLNRARQAGHGALIYAHPSACELGAVRELVDDFTAKGHHSCARDLEAALQHRGDSRGGEG